MNYGPTTEWPGRMGFGVEGVAMTDHIAVVVLFFGFYRAKKAAKLNHTEALHYE